MFMYLRWVEKCLFTHCTHLIDMHQIERKFYTVIQFRRVLRFPENEIVMPNWIGFLLTYFRQNETKRDNVIGRHSVLVLCIILYIYIYIICGIHVTFVYLFQYVIWRAKEESERSGRNWSHESCDNKWWQWWWLQPFESIINTRKNIYIYDEWALLKWKVVRKATATERI